MAQDENTSQFQRGINKTTRSLFIFTSLWGLSTALLTFGPQFCWHFDRLSTALAAIVNVVAGIVMIRAFFNHLQSMDELQQRTHLEALALTLGVTMIFTVLYGSFPTAQILKTTYPSVILVVMSLTYITAVISLWLKRTRE